MTRRFPSLLSAMLLLLGASGAANAQSAPCAAHDAIAAALGQTFGEERLSHGTLDSGARLELWAAHDGATWTMLAVRPDGVACVVATGSGWSMPTPRDIYFAEPPRPKRRDA